MKPVMEIHDQSRINAVAGEAFRSLVDEGYDLRSIIKIVSSIIEHATQTLSHDAEQSHSKSAKEIA